MSARNSIEIINRFLKDLNPDHQTSFTVDENGVTIYHFKDKKEYGDMVHHPDSRMIEEMYFKMLEMQIRLHSR